MTQEERYKITSNDYTDLIIEYNRNTKLLERFPNSTPHTVNTRYAVSYAPSALLNNDFINKYSYSPIPHLFGLTSEKSLDASGVQKLRRIPNFNLRGKGILIGIIDTGVDYTNPIFIKEDGTSKILNLWDQTIDSTNQYPKDTYYGTEYSAAWINEALRNENPLSIVPSKDEIGHGTMLAGVIAGSEVPQNDFSGVVPDSDLVVVKLKQAKEHLRNFFLIPPNVPCYQENDILWAVQYILTISQSLNRPCAVCIGLGSSQGAHDGKGALSSNLSFLSGLNGFIVSISSGNEGSMKRHVYNAIDPTTGSSTVELNVGANETGFSMELWGTSPNIYSLDITSPTGEFIPRITESLQTHQEISFIFERTIIQIDFVLIEERTSELLILMRFFNPTPGLWKMRVYSRGDLTGSYNIWLPMNGFLTDTTFFIQSDPYTTITSPGNGLSPITVTAYNSDNGALYEKASKGYTRIGVIKPELAAPGVNVIVPELNKGFTTASGTGIAAAHMTGITAILLEWGIVKGFYPNMNTEVVKKYLIRGAKRSKTLEYPNKDWGYGIVDLYNAFNVLRTDFPPIPK